MIEARQKLCARHNTTTTTNTATTIPTTTTTATTTVPELQRSTRNHNMSRRSQMNCGTFETLRSGAPLLATICLASALALYIGHLPADAASARVNMQQIRQRNHYFLNEFCGLESKSGAVQKLKDTQDKTSSLFLTPKNTGSSLRLAPQQRMPSSISFGLGSSTYQQQAPAAPIIKQLNCTINIMAQKSHGLLVKINSIGLPKNLTKLEMILNQDSASAQRVQLEGGTARANYLLTQPSSSKIAINLQSFQPIDWSHISFDILFTVYKKGVNSTSGGGCPNSNWFDCGDNICVPSSLVCDNNRNCPNGSDEMIFYRCYSPLFWSIAASTALALTLVAIIVIVILVFKRRALSKEHSFSNNALAAEADLNHDNNSSKLDLTHEIATGARGSSYLANNLYLSGFENPVWTQTGTLTKQHQSPASSATASTPAPPSSAPDSQLLQSSVNAHQQQ